MGREMVPLADTDGRPWGMVMLFFLDTVGRPWGLNVLKCRPHYVEVPPSVIVASPVKTS